MIFSEYYIFFYFNHGTPNNNIRNQFKQLLQNIDFAKMNQGRNYKFSENVMGQLKDYLALKNIEGEICN